MVVIAVSYDSMSLNRRMESLQKLGHIVVPASSLAAGRTAIEGSRYHVLLIGATVTAADRLELANISKALYPRSKIISVELPETTPLKLADMRIVAGDEAAMLMAITSVISGGNESDLEERRR